ncbi:MAG: hypothetical protein ACLQVI_04240 [Polyangiaceae bacterium]|jgi:hypothetical protein
MALPSRSGLRFDYTAGAAYAALTLVLTPGVAHAQGYAYPPPPPPPPPPVQPPPPPPPPPYYREYRQREPEPFSALALGVDFEGAVPLNAPQLADGNNLTGGSGIKLRVGEQLRLAPGFRFTPEVGYGYDHLFATDNIGDAYSWDMNRVFFGARVAFGSFFVPSIYGHVGYGWRTTGEPDVLAANGVAADVGGALDLRFFRHFQFGVHGEWVTVDAQPYAPEWVALGVHLDLIL